jgi:NADPH:quinone reductase
LTYAGLIATADERREGITKTLAAVAEGSLRLQIGAEWPLESVNEAFGQLEHRTVTGKVLLKLR